MRMCKDCGCCYHGPSQTCPNCASTNTMGAADRIQSAVRLCLACGYAYPGNRVKCPSCGSTHTTGNTGNCQAQPQPARRSDQQPPPIQSPIINW